MDADVEKIEAQFRAWAEARRAHARTFSREIFSPRTLWRSFRSHLARDLVSTSINVLWTVPYLSIKSLAPWFDKVGWKGGVALLARLPEGLRTGSQADLERALREEFLGLGTEGSAGGAGGDPLPHVVASDPAFRALAEKQIAELMAKRGSLRDVVASGLAFIAGWLVFNRKGLDPTALGDAAARMYAKKKAASGFFLGEKLGGHWYSLFPPTPSRELVIGMTVGVMVGLALAATLLGLVLEPLQARLGIQERHLRALVGTLEAELLDKHKYALLARGAERSATGEPPATVRTARSA